MPIQEWTFEAQCDDRYYLTTMVDGQKKYLTINGQNVTLEDSPDPQKSVIKATPGTGANAGKWHFSVNNTSLNFPNNAASGFNAATGTGARTWMNLVEKTTMGDDDFIRYAAKKVSVSDNTQVYDGKQVVIYTRVWNETTKRYDFYAVDHDGSLIKCYDIGDGIEWIGSDVNTATWDFTEYANSDGTPNYYYELQNSQLGEYIAPQMTGEQVLSDNTIGINLNGRRYGRSYTTITAWDDDSYSYAGLKVENGRLVSCPLAEADDFYFAIMDPTIMEEESLTTVATVDNSQYGIKMKAVDFNNAPYTQGKAVRDSVQVDYLGFDSNAAGLLSTQLEGNGYPTIAANTSHSGQSLGRLFAGTGENSLTDVNHLFIQSIYNESGYFEYDSTENFAHLEDSGDYTVYNQLAHVNNDNGNTRAHGQFMPYNELVEGQFSTVTNRTNVLGQELPDSDPRKGEKLYNITSADADFFFGMEMEANFTQTANGLDAWGHDIIFEFSGDDDFWFYVDGELVLDLGGVHSAMTGSINFRTGVVTSSRPININGTMKTTYTLREVFESNYRSRNPQATDAEVEAFLAEHFEPGEPVFKDYSDHTMKMFYMERGAGASNLHMRFNLAAVKPGTFILDKKLSGTDSPNNDLIEFPYQIYYKDGNGDERLLPKSDGETDYVKYQDSTVSVKHKETYTPSGGTERYDSVFFLKPGQAAEVTLPEGAKTYRVVECGVNPSVYDKVSVNGTQLNGVNAYDKATNNTVNGVARHDYTTPEYVLGETSKASFDNHVADGAMRVLTITKQLYDSDGTTLLHYDPATGEKQDTSLFTYRLYLGDESTDDQNLPLANSYPYFVKNRDNEYCKWDSSQKKFVSLGIRDYGQLRTHLDTLSAVEQASIVFKTSPNGSISKIPADYTVEVRDLIIDAKFMVEERDVEIPRGYTLRLEDGYKRVDTGHAQNTQTTPISGTIEINTDPKVQVNNQKGWGLTVNKVWTDADFMVKHDPIYFAVFVQRSNANPEHANDHGLQLELVADTVRQLKSGQTSVYYFFENLQSGTPFRKYFVREVTVTPPAGQEVVVGEDGKVAITEGTTVEPILQGETFTIGGQSVTDSEYQQTGYTYKATYEQGQITDETANVRVDTATNSRPGIELRKTDWQGDALSGARFTLTRASDGEDVSTHFFTSDSSGLITIAYLPAGAYKLTEVEAPNRYVGLYAPLMFEVDENSHITGVSGVAEDLYSYTNHASHNAAMAATVTVKNRSSDLVVKKVDSSTNEAIAGVHFALYPQVTDAHGNKVKAHNPLAGYEDLVTNANGVLEEVSLSLRAGTYYLTETAVGDGYQLLGSDLCFTIGKDGTVSMAEDAFGHEWLKREVASEVVSYSLVIPNSKKKAVEILKTGETASTILPGASFALYKAADYDDDANTPRSGATPMAEGTTDEQGLLLLGSLDFGEYRLVETRSPAGYNALDAPVRITVAAQNVTALEGGNALDVTHDTAADVWRVPVWNTAGYELPHTGGPGTLPFTLLGALLVLLAVMWSAFPRHRCSTRHVQSNARATAASHGGRVA